MTRESSLLWRPPYLVVSTVILIFSLILVALRPTLWPLGILVVVTAQAIIIGSGFVPKSRLLGSNMSRLPESQRPPNGVALTFDDGPDPEVTPQILKILAEHNINATFFCIGNRAQDHPGIIREIANAGHTLGNHSWSHSNTLWFFGPVRLARELDSTQSLLEDVCGATPVHFRAPAGIRSPLLNPTLVRHNLELVSWTRRGFDTVDTNPDRILRRLVGNLGPGDILLLHDGSSARDSEGRPVVLEVLPRLLDEINARGLEPIPLPRPRQA